MQREEVFVVQHISTWELLSFSGLTAFHEGTSCEGWENNFKLIPSHLFFLLVSLFSLNLSFLWSLSLLFLLPFSLCLSRPLCRRYRCRTSERRSGSVRRSSCRSSEWWRTWVASFVLHARSLTHAYRPSDNAIKHVNRLQAYAWRV